MWKQVDKLFKIINKFGFDIIIYIFFLFDSKVTRNQVFYR